MKKLSLLFAFMLIASVVEAQNMGMDDNGNQDNETTGYDDYNHWSVELQGGVTTTARPMSSGYSTSSVGFGQFGVDARYMINEKFGFMYDIGYNHFSDASSSKDFSSHIIRTSLQGVANLGNVLGFRNWTDRLNLLGHAGLGYANLDGDDFVTSSDNMGFVTAGLTPQIRLGNNFALSGDISLFGDFKQDRTFDGMGTTHTRGFNGYYMNGSIGITYYFGDSDKKHADWYSRTGSEQDRIARLEDKFDNLEGDYEGHVSDFDSHVNDFDQLRDDFDNFNPESADAEDMIRKLINGGYVNVYFKFDSTQPEDYSLEAINYVVKYLDENGGDSVTLHGYADEIGSSDYNQTLSENRAESVKDILVDLGVSENQIDTQGQGEDDTSDAKEARKLLRRVTFELN